MLRQIAAKCKGQCKECEIDIMCSIIRNTEIEALKPKELKAEIMDAIESKAHMQDVYIEDKAYVRVEDVEKILGKCIKE